MVIVGNKSDLETVREVTKKEGEELAKSFGCIFQTFTKKLKLQLKIELMWMKFFLIW